MQKAIVLLGLLLSITGALYAQGKKNAAPSREDRMFELPPYITQYEAQAALGNGNKMRLELTEREHFNRFRNIDSLLLVFLSDIKSLQDSLSDPLMAKRIDYVVDTAGQKKIRIRQTKAAASTYLVQDGGPAVLRLEQDTVFILLPVAPDKMALRDGIQRYDRLGFFLNRYEELNSLITAGLNHKVELMQTRVKGSWVEDGNRAFLKSDPTITSRFRPRTMVQAELSLKYHVDIQNYKSYFTPSFQLGMSFSIHKQGNVNSFSAEWEPVFLFAHDAQGTLQTYRNDFLVFGYSYGKEGPRRWNLKKGNAGTTDQPDPPAFNIDLNFSLGYLINRQGDYFAKHTFRFCIGSINLAKNAIRIQPCMYFNDFLRGVTPGVRIIF